MTPDDVNAAVARDRDAGRRTALVSLADAAAEYLDAQAKFRRVAESDVEVDEDELTQIIGRVATSEAELSRAVGYLHPSPMEQPDAEANKRIADALWHLADDEDGDPEWKKKFWEKIDRRERERWWRRLGRWIGIGK